MYWLSQQFYCWSFQCSTSVAVSLRYIGINYKCTAFHNSFTVDRTNAVLLLQFLFATSGLITSVLPFHNSLTVDRSNAVLLLQFLFATLGLITNVLSFHNSFTVDRSNAVLLLQFLFALFVLFSLESCFVMSYRVILTLFGALGGPFRDCGFPNYFRIYIIRVITVSYLRSHYHLSDLPCVNYILDDRSKYILARVHHFLQDWMCVHKDSDQPVHPVSLIRIFVVRLKTHWIIDYP